MSDGDLAATENPDVAGFGTFGTMTGYSAGFTSNFFIQATIPFFTPGNIYVNLGDLVFVACTETTSTSTSTTCTDSLGNTYTPVQAVTVSGNITGRAYYSIITNPGIISNFGNPIIIHQSGVSGHRLASIAAIIRGPFDPTSALDANPTNITSDATSPFTCPATGTLSSANEVVMAWGSANDNVVWSATSPNKFVARSGSGSIANASVGYQRVFSTASVTPEFTAASNPPSAVLGTSSFKQAVAAGGTAWAGAALLAAAANFKQGNVLKVRP